MSYDPENHLRKSIRLKGYDYSQAGLYFITICTQERKHFFGKIENGKIILNGFGKVAEEEWIKTAEIRKNILLHEYVVMPNHFHGIVEITHKISCADEIDNKFKLPSNNIGAIVRGFKAAVCRGVLQYARTDTQYARTDKIWHRNYWEHIIRNGNEYNRISDYIKNNPSKWNNDKLNNGTGNIVMDSTSPYNEEIWMMYL